MTAWVTLPA